MNLLVLIDWLRRSTPTRRRLLTAVGISLLGSAASLGLFGGAGLLVGKAAQGGQLTALGILLVAIELVAFLRAPLRYEERIVAHRVALGSMVRWRTWLFATLCRIPPTRLASGGSGELLDRAVEDIDALEDLWVRVLLPVLGAITTGLLGVVVALIVEPLAGLVLLVTLVLGCFVAAGLTIGTTQLATEEATARGQATAATVDLLDGMSELAVSGTTARAQQRVFDAEVRRARAHGALSRRRALGLSLEGLLLGLGTAGAALCAGAAHHAGRLSGPGALGLALVGFAALEPLGSVAMALLRWGEVAAAALRLEELEVHSVAPPQGTAVWSGAGMMRLSHVAARPDADARQVLVDVNLEIPPGASVAVLGSSGAGKSTLGELLLGLITPESGSIEVDGIALAALGEHERRARLGHLDQHAELFSGSVADALRLGAPDASDAALREALGAVELSHVELTRQIGERASSLSGGEARRIALARALLRTPSILILDEPTAGLGPEQARSVLDACLAGRGDASVVLFTHRAEEAARCDVRYALEDGRLHRIA